MIENIFNRFIVAAFAAPVVLICALGYYSPLSDSDARRRCLLYGLIALGVLLACATVRADVGVGGGTAGLGTGSGYVVGDGSDGLDMMVPFELVNLTGTNVEFDFVSTDGVTVLYSLFYPVGITGPSYLDIPPDFGSLCYYVAGDSVHNQSVTLDLTGTNMNQVVLAGVAVMVPGSFGAGGGPLDNPGGAYVVNYPYLRSGGNAASAFYWSWFLAGWGLAIGGIMSALVWRQVRNIGADAPTM